MVISMKTSEFMAAWRNAIGNGANISSKGDDLGYTTEELTNMFGCCATVVGGIMRDMNNAGLITVGHRRAIRIDGIGYRVPVYRLKENDDGL